MNASATPHVVPTAPEATASHATPAEVLAALRDGMKTLALPSTTEHNPPPNKIKAKPTAYEPLDNRAINQAAAQLTEYLVLLSHWNRRFNLISPAPPLQVVNRHILDSLAVARFLQGRHLADLGSGAGLPGLPLAVVYPELRVTLIESRVRRAQFLQHAVSELALPNVHVQSVRSLAYHPPEPFDTVISRAFGSVVSVVRHATHLCRVGGCIILMKGVRPLGELTEFRREQRLLRGGHIKARDIYQVADIREQRLRRGPPVKPKRAEPGQLWDMVVQEYEVPHATHRHVVMLTPPERA